MPKFNGTENEFPMWRRNLLAYLLQIGVRQAINPTDNPVAVGSNRVNNVELNARHSARSIDDATLAWTTLMKAVNRPQIIAKTFSAGCRSRSEA